MVKLLLMVDSQEHRAKWALDWGMGIREQGWHWASGQGRSRSKVWDANPSRLGGACHARSAK